MEVDNRGGAMAVVHKLFPDMRITDNVNDVAYVFVSKGESYLAMFKREYYKNFKYHFPHCKKPTGTDYGWAQIMSLSLLKLALMRNVKEIVFITPDAKAYACTPADFMSFYKQHTTNVPHLAGEVAMPLDNFRRVQP
ncbi:MAG: hypothetical protein MUP55_01730 [Candidatus Aenigmarchaeota archaeon]|nr:hypothetical protein [Candidatus Aenigmarchaeota archaeon]